MSPTCQAAACQGVARSSLGIGMSLTKSVREPSGSEGAGLEGNERSFAVSPKYLAKLPAKLENPRQPFVIPLTPPESFPSERVAFCRGLRPICRRSRKRRAAFLALCRARRRDDPGPGHTGSRKHLINVPDCWLLDTVTRKRPRHLVT